MANGYDVVIAWLSVHGGGYHKIIALHEELQRRGLSCAVLFSDEKPLGLQRGMDLDDADAERLAENDVFLCSHEAMTRFVAEARPRMLVIDAHYDDRIGSLIRQARDQGAITVQIPSVLFDYGYHGADHVFLPHPLTLYCEIDWKRTSLKRVAEARAVHFVGNVLTDPVPNTWTSDIRTREDLCAKYGFDPTRPLCFWLPDREDGTDQMYGRIVSMVREAGYNLAVKLHPWEYKMVLHGYDPFGNGTTSAEHWGVPAIEERDSSWMYHFGGAGITRSSAIGLELAFWDVPVVYPPCRKRDRKWQRVYYNLGRESARRLGSLDQLPEALSGVLEQAGSMDFQAVRDREHPVPGTTAIELHAQAILGLLEGRDTGTPVQTLAGVRKLFLGRLPLGALRPRHVPAHLFHKIFG